MDEKEKQMQCQWDSIDRRTDGQHQVSYLLLAVRPG